MNSIKYLLIALALVGCATKQEYAFQATRPNMDFPNDKYVCLERAQALRNADLFYTCMEARGWKKVPKNQPQGDSDSSNTAQGKSTASSATNRANWIQYASKGSEQVEYFFDPSSVWRNGDTVKVSDMASYKTMQPILDGKAYYNQMKSRHEINCKTKQYKLESMVFVYTNSQKSEVVLDVGGDSKPRPISNKSVIGLLADAVCD